MAKNIIMQVLTSAGYEPMYPFNPRQTLNASFLATSTSSQYNISINGIPTPLTNSFGNDMGLIVFTPTINNVDNIKLSLNGEGALPIVFSDGVQVRANTLQANRAVIVRYNNNKFYLILDKNQIGLSNVDNTSARYYTAKTTNEARLNTMKEIYDYDKKKDAWNWVCVNIKK